MYFFAAKQSNKTTFAEKLGHMPRYTCLYSYTVRDTVYHIRVYCIISTCIINYICIKPLASRLCESHEPNNTNRRIRVRLLRTKYLYKFVQSFTLFNAFVFVFIHVSMYCMYCSVYVVLIHSLIDVKFIKLVYILHYSVIVSTVFLFLAAMYKIIL